MKNKANPSNLDVIIPVHNALSDVKNCINSVLQNTSSNFSIIIVNDGSDDEASLYLRNVTESDERVELLVNNEAQGYTKAANKGLKHSNADYKVLLNSDTIVPKNWDKKLIACAVTEEAGLVGPLSNAASWQSVPNRFSADGGWAINQLPDGFDVNKFDKLVENVSTKSKPQVEILNGFCTLFKKEVFDKIGYLDEEAFPRGYGEENDLCFRASDAGFKIVVATDTYVYHAKSKSFGKRARNELAQKGSEALTAKHGNDRINKAVFSLKHNKQLEETRTAISSELKKIKKKYEKVETETLNVLFLLPISGVAGGIHSIYQEMTGMRELGVNAKIATWHYNKPDYERAYSVGDSVSEQFYFFNDFEEVTDYAGKFDVVVATIHNSIILLKRIYEKYPNILPAYYVQDYEPFFFEQGSEQWKIANDSYTLIPDMMLFAKTDWLCKTVESFHNKKVEKVDPSLDTSVYYPNFSKNNQQEKTKIVAMVRPSTPRRGAERTMRVLKRIQNKYGDSVEINIFGTVEERFEDFNLTRDFEYINHEVLTREEVAELLRSSDIFIDLSVYQAFGRTGLEAMASGCAVVLPQRGGTSEYAVDKQNALLVDTSKDETCFEGLDKLVADHKLRNGLIANGIKTSSKYSIRRAAIFELLVFKYMIQNRTVSKDAVTKVDIKQDRFFNENGAITYRVVSVILYSEFDKQITIEQVKELRDKLSEEDEIIIVSKSDVELTSLLDSNSHYGNIKIANIDESSDLSVKLNKAIEIANNPYMLFLEVETVLPQNFFKKILKFFDNKKAAAVAPLINSEVGFQSLRTHLKEKLRNTDVELINSQLETQFNEIIAKTEIVSLKCVTVRKESFNRVAKLNSYKTEQYVAADFFWRLRSHGLAIGVCLDTYVQVKESPSNKNHSSRKDDEKVFIERLKYFYGSKNIPSPKKIFGNDISFSSTFIHNEETSLIPKSRKDTPVNAEPVTLIVLSYNNKPYLEECLVSIANETNIPYEILIVDNASDKETVAFLHEYETTNPFTTVIYNEKNLGFPKGINQAIKEVKTRQFVIMNNDIVVTNNWLTKLVAVANTRSDIGIVGPISNIVSGAQLDKFAKYSTINEMNNYAEEVSKKSKGEVLEFPRVAFLCTLIKREVIDKIGGLDERFTPGNYEDDDFCLRAQAAGYKTVIAKDVFIHHYGSKSFGADGQEKYAQRLKINEEKFVNKWGADPNQIWLKGAKVKSRNISYPLNKSIFIESFSRAMLHAEENELSLALDEALRAIEHYEQSERTGFENISKWDVYNFAANLAFQIGDLERAQDLFKMELEGNPNSGKACLGLAEVFNEAQLFEQAKTMYEWAIKNGENNELVKNKLGLVNVKLDLPENDFTLKSETITEEYTIENAEELINNSDLSGAEKILNKLLETNPQSIDVLNDFAVVNIMQNKHAAALEKLQKVIELDPSNSIAIENLNYIEETLASKS